MTYHQRDHRFPLIRHTGRGRRVVFAALIGLLPWCGAQAQTISGATTGPITGNGGALTVTNTGSITNPSGFAAVQANSGGGAITTLTNNGTLSSQGFTVQTSSTGSITTLQNNATIAATLADGPAINSAGTIGTLNNAAGASISGGTNNGSGIAITGTGTIGAINNAGTISGGNGILLNGTLTAIDNQSGGLISGANGYGLQGGNALGSFTNEAGATISGSQYSFKLNASNAGPQPALGSFSNAGTMTGSALVQGGNRSLNIGSFSNSGSITDTVGNGGVSLAGGTGGVTSTLGNVTNSGSITSTGPGLQVLTGFSSIGTLSNSGSISGGTTGVQVAPGSGVTASFSNTGSIQGTNIGFQGSTGFGTLTNAVGGTISGKTAVSYQFDTSGTLGLVNNGTITATQVAFQDSTTNGVQVGQITNTGTMSGQIFFKSAGTIIGGGGTSFGVLNPGTQSGFSGIFSTGSVTFSGNNRLNENVTTNNGTNNQGTVSNNGILQLAAKQTMTGFFSQSSSGGLDLEFAGGSFGQYGNLTSTLAASIAGTLSLDSISGFSFHTGQTFDVMDFSSRSGDFTGMAMDGVACTSAGTDFWACGGFGVTEVFTSTRLNLVLSDVPEPASMAVLSLGVGALAGMRRRRLR